MKEVLKAIVEPTEHADIICLTDLEHVKGTERFTYYIETKKLLKADKTYRVTIEELT